MISRRGILLSAISLLPLSRAMYAQQAPTFSTGVRVVNVFATVRDKQGQIVKNLTKDDFTLEEDGRPQTIRYFAQQTDLPLTLGLVVDTSGSMRRVLGTERQASYTFLEQVLRPDKDKAFLIHFDREVELLQDLTSSRKRLEQALELLQTPDRYQASGGGSGQGSGSGGWGGGGGYGRRGYGHREGGTALYDAVLLASDELMSKQSGRKAIIVLSDGEDNASKVSLPEAINSAQRADTLAYSVRIYDQDANNGFRGPMMGRHGGFGGGPYGRGPAMNRTDGKKVLQQLSTDTGAHYFEVSKKASIDQIYSQIEEELRNQYSLGYTPDRADPGAGFHKIHVTVKQKGLTVQARDGYYAGA